MGVGSPAQLSEKQSLVTGPARGPTVARYPRSRVIAPTHSGHEAADGAHTPRNTRRSPRRRPRQPNRVARPARSRPPTARAAAASRAPARRAGGVAHRRILEVRLMSSPAIGRHSPPRPPRSTRTAIATRGCSAGAKPMNHECGSPEPPSSAVPDLPAVVTPGTFAPRVNAGRGRLPRPRSSPRWIAAASRASMTPRRTAPGRSSRVAALAAERRYEAGLMSSPSLRRSSATSAIWSGVTKVSAWP